MLRFVPARTFGRLLAVTLPLYFAWEFTAHNPGDWLPHCHKPVHMDGGMIGLVKTG